MSKYNNFEQKFLDNLPGVTNKIIDKLDIKSMINQESPTEVINYDMNNEPPIIEGGETKAAVRVRTDGVSKPPVEYYGSFSGINNNVASSFVLIVAGVVVLISLVASVTFSILNYLS